MRPFRRLDPPDWLREHAQAWGEEYARKKVEKRSHRFEWKPFRGKKVNHHLLPKLKEQTDNHCSYCDRFPPFRNDETIDHFCPKGDSRFYGLVYEWENLYLACGNCQAAKLEQYDADLLRPDEPSFHFEYYFNYNYYEHILEPNLERNEADQRKAKTTIRLLGLNDEAHKRLREQTLMSYMNTDRNMYPLETFAYRFILEI